MQISLQVWSPGFSSGLTSMCSSMKKLNHFQQKTSKLNLALFWVSVDLLLWFCQVSVCFSVFVLSQQRFGVTDIKAPSASRQTMLQLLDKSVLRLSVTALFYLGDSRKIHLRGVRAHRSKDMKRRAPQRAGAERERARGTERECEPFGPFFNMFFLPPGPALCKLGSARSAVLPEVLTQVLGPSFDLPLFYFHGFFPSSSFSHCHFGLLFPVLTA